MKKRSLTVFALLCIIAGSFLVQPAGSRAAGVVAGLPTGWRRSFNVESSAPNAFASAEADEQFAALKSLGANEVALVVQLHQSDQFASDIKPSDQAPSDDALSHAVQRAHALGMRVTIAVHVDVLNCCLWRGHLDPSDVQGWFAAYQVQLLHYAALAQRVGVEEVSLGAELENLTQVRDEPYWEEVVAAVRNVYDGNLTYALNRDWSSRHNGQPPAFLSLLDVVSLSAYAPLGDSPEPTKMLQMWAQWDQNEVAPLVRLGKPIVFSEVGYRSVKDARVDPAVYDPQRAQCTVDQQEQVNDYQVFFDYWSQRPYVQGAHFWRWEVTDRGSRQCDFTPQGKPAQAVIAQWFTTPQGIPVQVPRRVRPVRPSPVVTGDHHVTVVQPSNGAAVSGVIHLLVSVSPTDPTDVSWRVGQGQWVVMTPEGSGRWGADIDVTSWDWEPTGTYVLTACAVPRASMTSCSQTSIEVA